MEHQRVFNYRQSSFRPARQTSRNKRNQKSQIKTCTLKFFCLGHVDDNKPPSTVAKKTELSSCGLGPGVITFEQDVQDIHLSLIEKFPPLSSGGGYELLLYQRGDQSGFYKVPPPYAPLKLKEIAGQSHVYIRPLQQDILQIQKPQALNDVSYVIVILSSTVVGVT